MGSKEIRFGYVPVPDAKEGLAIARDLVSARLAACANLLGPMTSVYEWEGRLEESVEYVLILKTTGERTERATERVVELHPYECPCVIWLDVVDAYEGFLRWIGQELACDPSQ